MTPMQQLFLGQGSKNKVFLDDVFSTYLWKGTGSDQTINTGLDMAGEGGMVWVKNRSSSKNHAIVDTVRGAGKWIESNTADAEDTYATTGANPRNLNSFTSTGFTLKSDDGNQYFNWPTGDPKYTSWNFRKAKGFFDIVTWTGNSDTNQTISHSLKSIPGMIIAKRTDSSTTGDWVVYHRDHVGYLKLNSSNGAVNDSGAWTPVTSTSFKAYDYINVDGASYVAYIFAGGESDAATARSVDFSGSSDEIFENSTGSVLRNWFDQAFTVEYWVKADALASGSGGGTNAVGVSTLGTSNLSWSFGPNNTGQIRFSYWNGSAESTILPSETIKIGQWYHLAFVHDGSNNCKIFINGTLGKEATISNGTANAGDMVIGQVQSTQFNGKVSNLRITHQALYTTSFRPPTEPLTTTSQGATASNVKLLCCNNSSVTGSTVSPSGMGNNGSPIASTDSPFDDPAAFKFGESGSESVIKCGSYVGADASTEVNLDFEPQFLLLKRTSGSSNWHIFDSMRGISDGGNDAYLYPDGNWQEDNTNVLKVTPTGFKFEVTMNGLNGSGGDFIFLAIRRSDGYVGKPYGAGEGTSVFGLTTGTGSSTIPNFVSGFPVDFALNKWTSTTSDWYAGARLIQGKRLEPNTNDEEITAARWVFDSNAGWNDFSTFDSGNQSWMWKRHAGFDVVVTGPGTGSGMVVRHNLGRTPEMIIAKKRATSNWPGNSNDNYVLDNWFVWHKDANASAVAGYLNTDGFGGLNMVFPADVTSVSAKFHSNITYTDDKNVMLFFASVDGISKVGSYTGNGVKTGNVQTVGFVPRFILIKCADTASTPWMVFDTLLGINSGDDNFLSLNTNNSTSAGDFIDLTSDGFDVVEDLNHVNGNNKEYIYYCHA